MIKQQVSEDGLTPEEFTKTLYDGLEVDAFSFSAIVSYLRHEYDLNLEALIYYVRLGIYELYDHGARPVGMAPKEIPYDWVLLPQYGKSKEEIADNVIQEWKNNNYNDPDYDKLWFALVDEYCYVPEDTTS